MFHLIHYRSLWDQSSHSVSLAATNMSADPINSVKALKKVGCRYHALVQPRPIHHGTIQNYRLRHIGLTRGEKLSDLLSKCDSYRPPVSTSLEWVKDENAWAAIHQKTKAPHSRALYARLVITVDLLTLTAIPSMVNGWTICVWSLVTLGVNELILQKPRVRTYRLTETYRPITLYAPS